MKVFDTLHQSIRGVGTLPLLAIVVVVALSTISLVALFDLVNSTAAVGFLGVILGSAIASAMSLLTARENQRNQLRMAALEKRLEVHQEGYRLWREIVHVVHNDEKRMEVLGKAERWWAENCLYLDPDSRQAFRTCIFSAENHNNLLTVGRSSPQEKVEIKESWDQIMRPGQTLVSGVALPPLGGDENPPDLKDA